MKVFQTGRQWLIMGLLLFTAGIITSCDRDDTQPETQSIRGIALNAISFDKLEGATLTAEPAANSSSSASTRQTQVDSDGNYLLEDIVIGRYNIYIDKEGYYTMSANNIDLVRGKPFIAMLPVTHDIETPIGGITGIIMDNEGNPIPNANISISAQDESISNGYFSSTKSNEKGEFYIGAIPVSPAINNVFKIRCIADGKETQIIQNKTILQNEMVVLYFELKEELPATAIFHEGFESMLEGWEMDGFWHIHDNSAIYNEAYPDFVQLAPNDNSEGRIPNAYKGSHAAWYGDPETGNFMGEQNSNDHELSGGTSVVANKGEMTSPEINLKGITQASVNFRSWFEVESVNPNEYGFDLMEVYVIDEDENEQLLGKLNPYTDPVLPDRAPLPYTSGGFNQAPVWRYEEFDLGAFTGGIIRLKFLFDTRDGLYNGFRGWMIDELQVVNKPAAETTKSAPDPTRPLMQRDHN